MDNGINGPDEPECNFEGLNIATDILEEGLDPDDSWQNVLDDSFGHRPVMAMHARQRGVNSTEQKEQDQNEEDGKLSPAGSVVSLIYSGISSGFLGVASASVGSSGLSTGRMSNMSFSLTEGSPSFQDDENDGSGGNHKVNITETGTQQEIITTLTCEALENLQKAGDKDANLGPDTERTMVPEMVDKSASLDVASGDFGTPNSSEQELMIYFRNSRDGGSDPSSFTSEQELSMYFSSKNMVTSTPNVRDNMKEERERARGAEVAPQWFHSEEFGAHGDGDSGRFSVDGDSIETTSLKENVDEEDALQKSEEKSQNYEQKKVKKKSSAINVKDMPGAFRFQNRTMTVQNVTPVAVHPFSEGKRRSQVHSSGNKTKSHKRERQHPIKRKRRKVSYGKHTSTEMLSRMLRTASDAIIDEDISAAKMLNITTPDASSRMDDGNVTLSSACEGVVADDDSFKDVEDSPEGSVHWLQTASEVVIEKDVIDEVLLKVAKPDASSLMYEDGNVTLECQTVDPAAESFKTVRDYFKNPIRPVSMYIVQNAPFQTRNEALEGDNLGISDRETEITVDLSSKSNNAKPPSYDNIDVAENINSFMTARSHSEDETHLNESNNIKPPRGSIGDNGILAFDKAREDTSPSLDYDVHNSSTPANNSSMENNQLDSVSHSLSSSIITESLREIEAENVDELSATCLDSNISPAYEDTAEGILFQNVDDEKESNKENNKHDIELSTEEEEKSTVNERHADDIEKIDGSYEIYTPRKTDESVQLIEDLENKVTRQEELEESERLSPKPPTTPPSTPTDISTPTTTDQAREKEENVEPCISLSPMLDETPDVKGVTKIFDISSERGNIAEDKEHLLESDSGSDATEEPLTCCAPDLKQPNFTTTSEEHQVPVSVSLPMPETEQTYFMRFRPQESQRVNTAGEFSEEGLSKNRPEDIYAPKEDDAKVCRYSTSQKLENIGKGSKAEENRSSPEMATLKEAKSLSVIEENGEILDSSYTNIESIIQECVRKFPVKVESASSSTASESVTNGETKDESLQNNSDVNYYDTDDTSEYISLPGYLGPSDKEKVKEGRNDVIDEVNGAITTNLPKAETGPMNDLTLPYSNKDDARNETGAKMPIPEIRVSSFNSCEDEYQKKVLYPQNNAHTDDILKDREEMINGEKSDTDNSLDEYLSSPRKGYIKGPYGVHDSDSASGHVNAEEIRISVPALPQPLLRYAPTFKAVTSAAYYNGSDVGSNFSQRDAESMAKDTPRGNAYSKLGHLYHKSSTSLRGGQPVVTFSISRLEDRRTNMSNSSPQWPERNFISEKCQTIKLRRKLGEENDLESCSIYDAMGDSLPFSHTIQGFDQERMDQVDGGSGVTDFSSVLVTKTDDELLSTVYRPKYEDLDEKVEKFLNPTPQTTPRSCHANHPGFVTPNKRESNYISESSRKRDDRFRAYFPFDAEEKAQIGSSRAVVPRPTASILKSVVLCTSPEILRAELCRSGETKKYDISDSGSDLTSVSRSNYKNYGSYQVSKSRAVLEKQIREMAESLSSMRTSLDQRRLDISDLEEGLEESKLKLNAIESKRRCDSEATYAHFGDRDDDYSRKRRSLDVDIELARRDLMEKEIEIERLSRQLLEAREKNKILKVHFSDSEMDHHKINEELCKRAQRQIKNIEALQEKIDRLTRERDEALRLEGKSKTPPVTSPHRDSFLDILKSPISRKSPNAATIDDLRDRIQELELMNKSSSSELAFAETTLESLKEENKSLRRSYDQELMEMKLENSKMKDKMDRMNELSAENLLLASDAADLQGELSELRSEARDLRNRCHELTEDNRQLKMEVRDLRRYIEAITKNRNVDPRQELLEKIEYYQNEHDRLLEEIRSLKGRLGELTPRSPRSRSPVCTSPRRSPIPSSMSRSQQSSSGKGVRFSDKPSDCRTAAGDALAAVTATAHAADRVVKDKAMSPSVALNLRDLTMDRYHKHMEGADSPRSVDSDNTECLLKPLAPKSSTPCKRGIAVSDEDEEFNETTGSRLTNGKRCDSPGRSRNRLRRSQITPVSRSRSTSPPLGVNGYRSISPRNACVQRSKPRTDYPPEMAKSLPRRAFAPRNPSDLKLGYAIKFTRPGGKVSRGTVKYIGHLPGRSEVFVGVESDNFDGKHCGTFQGSKYFSCPPNKGIFTPFSKIILAWE